MMKKKYIAPGVTVVSFRNERGYASSSIVTPLEEQINLMLVMEDEESELRQYISSVQYSYDVDLMPYSEDENGKIGKTDAIEVMQIAMASSFGGDYSNYFGTYGQMFSTLNVSTRSSVSSSRLQKKSMPVRVSSSRILVT